MVRGAISKTADVLIRAAWQGDADDLYPLSQASHALGLAVDYLVASRSGITPLVWFPDYFCESALSLVRRSGVKIAFYPVTSALTPDWDGCRQMSIRHRPDLFVLVHYFGHAADGQNARTFCDEVGALLFEDAAHVIRPREAIGRHGDLVCYSPRKFFPIPDGGLLVVRGSDLCRSMARIVQHRPNTRASAARWVAKRAVRSVRRRLLLPRKPPGPLPPTTHEAEPIAAAPFDELWMSNYSRLRLQYLFMSNEVDRIERNLFAGHSNLSSALANCTDMQPIEIVDTLIPYFTVMRCNSEALALRYLNELRAAGAEVFTWPTLPQEVKADPIRHREALRLRRTLLCFMPGWRGKGTLAGFLAGSSLDMPHSPVAMIESATATRSF
jgi:DegT/DnrJ/EryC1/StrS aminotransferase family